MGEVRMLANEVWPDIPDAALVLVPVGSTEQHGPHLPFDTDTVIADAVARRVAALLGESRVLVAPAISYGSSGEHQAFAGTASLGTEALRFLMVELVRSLRTWARRVVFVNAHGGNVAALADAVGQLRHEGHDVAWLPCATEEVDLHAGQTETSLLLHLCPERVRLDRAEAGDPRPLDVILPILLAEGVRAVSANGVLGDPTGATAQAGERLLEQMARWVADRALAGEPAP